MILQRIVTLSLVTLAACGPQLDEEGAAFESNEQALVQLVPVYEHVRRTTRVEYAYSTTPWGDPYLRESDGYYLGRTLARIQSSQGSRRLPFCEYYEGSSGAPTALIYEV